MEYDEMFTVLSMCFAPVGQDEWKQLIDGPLWSDFLDAARRGLPESAVPAESLYTTWSNGSLPSPFSKAEGMYQGDSARYMRDLVERMGMRVPPEFSACPDHLALELDLAAVLLRSGMRDAARQFVLERFSWLTAYRMRLLELADDARFYIGLVDVLVGMREHLALTSGAGEQGVDADARAERNRLHACI